MDQPKGRPSRAILERFERMAKDESDALTEEYRGASPEKHARDFEAACHFAMELLESTGRREEILRREDTRSAEDVEFWLELVRRSRRSPGG